MESLVSSFQLLKADDSLVLQVHDMVRQDIAAISAEIVRAQRDGEDLLTFPQYPTHAEFECNYAVLAIATSYIKTDGQKHLVCLLSREVEITRIVMEVGARHLNAYFGLLVEAMTMV